MNANINDEMMRVTDLILIRYFANVLWGKEVTKQATNDDNTTKSITMMYQWYDAMKKKKDADMKYEQNIQTNWFGSLASSLSLFSLIFLFHFLSGKIGDLC